MTRNLRVIPSTQRQNLGWQDAVTSQSVSPERTYVERRDTAPAVAVEAEVMVFPMLMGG
jgi:hypothetical protein